jgi:hypothetical protein
VFALFWLRRESPDLDPGDGPLISEVVLSHGDMPTPWRWQFRFPPQNLGVDHCRLWLLAMDLDCLAVHAERTWVLFEATVTSLGLRAPLCRCRWYGIPLRCMGGLFEACGWLRQWFQ